ncbi:hypothetical protein [Chitinophaga sp.]|uniref:hypothetical protein n=1 Tax=Chitinophaga sp. TaxID=1869181 RepID=UPI0031DCC96F
MKKILFIILFILGGFVVSDAQPPVPPHPHHVRHHRHLPPHPPLPPHPHRMTHHRHWHHVRHHRPHRYHHHVYSQAGMPAHTLSNAFNV